MIRDFTELDRQIDNAERHDLWAYSTDNSIPEPPGRGWDQNIWIASCGTYGCIAGNTVLDAGLNGNHTGFIFDGYGRMLLDRNGDPIMISTMAAAILGLTMTEANAIFDGDNDIEVLRRLQKDLHAGRPIDHDLASAYQYEAGIDSDG